MSRYNTVLYNWTEVTNRLLHDKQLLAHFLRFSAGMYKQSFPDAALIYQQNPYATKVATLEVWNKLGRRVNRGEHSIAVFGEDCKCKHLFDVTQTEGKRIPDLWKLDESLAADLTAAVNQKYGAECKTIQETLAAVSVDNLKCRSTDMSEIISQMELTDEQKKTYQQSVVSAVRFMVACRCELDGGMKVSGGLNLNAVDLFHDTRDLIRFCDLVQRTAKDSLLEVEREVFQILNKRREREHEQEIKSDRTISQGNAVHGQPAGTGAPAPTDRQVGQNVAGVDENRTPDRDSSSGYGSTVAAYSERDRQAGGEPLGSTGRTVPQEESPTDGIRTDAAVGENPSADAGAYHHGRDRVPDSELTVAYLKECYLHADFNRRLDSYEMAGLAFTDGADLKIDEITFFNRFHADKFSPAQAQEIRQIMMVAMLNREKEQIVQDEPEQTEPAAEPEAHSETDVPVQPEPVTAEAPEPVIVNNFPLISGNLPLLTDESVIAGILTDDQFYNKKCGEIAAYFADHEDESERIAFLKSAYNTEYCEMNIGSVRVGYKTAENGLMVWEGSSYLSRSKEAGLTWDFVAAYIAKLIEENRYLKEPALQRSTKNADKNQLVIYSFNENEGVITADCSIGDNQFETEVLRTDDNTPYINYKGRPIQFTSQQAYDLEQFELFRAPIIHDRNGYYADDLDAGDQIRLDGEIWTVVIKNDYTIRLSNSEKSDPDNVQNIYGKWQEKLTKLGFEFIPQSREIETPVFAEPAEEAPEPESGDIQLTLFGEPVPIEKTEKKERPKKKTVTVSLTAPTAEMMDYVLRAGSNERRSIERIVAQFQKNKSVAENAEFLRKEFGTGGRGYKYSPPDYTSASLVAAWFNQDGITAAISSTAFPEGKNTHISWEQAAERIVEMLRDGEYCEQDKIDRAADYELQDIAERLLFLERDVEGDFFLPKEMTQGGFPECEAKVKAAMTDTETLKAYIAGMKLFLSQYEQNPDILRMHYHKPKELLRRLEDLQLARADFITKQDFRYEPQFFITDDEKDHLLSSHGSGVESGKFRIAEFFAEEHTLPEKIKFLKREYGDGGMGYVATKMSNVAGVQTTAAQKSEDMLMKTQYLNDKYGCNNILYSTGTPVSNSMVEFYVMQRYLRPDLLSKAGLETFDDWASTFGEVVSQLEIKPAGNGFQMKNRFSKFVNIPELMQMYKEFADIQTPDMIKLPVPELKTGAPIVVTAKPDDRQKAYMKELAARSERIHNGNVDPAEDNMLKITHEARLLGLDSRCIFRDADPAPDSKVMMLIDNLEQNYRDTMEQKGVQIVFCDIAINADPEHFSVYEAIKEELMRRGIPREEICFAGDAKTDKARADMFEQLRKGEKRFILASTSKLGTGANVQDRICAIHHLDIPWKPADLTQQDGRGIRQGNMFSEVGIYHYLTENTFDAYMMGIITNKAKFISQIMTSKDPVRVSEDVDETVLTYSQMQAIASGNPMIKEKIQLDNDIAMLKTLEAEHKKSVYKMQELAERRLPQQIENYAALLEKASGDLRAYQEQHPDNAEFQIEIEGKTYTDRAEAGAEIEKALIRCSTTGESIRLGKYFGFELTIERNQGGFIDNGTACRVCLHGNLKYHAELSLNNPIGNVRRIENLAGIQINAKIKQFSGDLDKAKQNLEDARAAMTKPFERAQELADMQKRLDYVNEQLSMDSPDEPQPVCETQDDIAAERLPSTVKVGMVSVAVPAAVYADRTKPQVTTDEKQKTVPHKIRR